MVRRIVRHWLKVTMSSKLSDRIRISILSVLFLTVIAITVALAFPESAVAINYNNRTLEAADFSKQDLTDSSFDHANLRNSNFSNSNLRGVRFFSSNLASVDFTGADLSYADLESARMTKANLTNAILEGAFTTGTMFDGAIIDGADFTDTYIREDTLNKLCQVAKGTNPVTGRNTRDTLACP